MFDDIVIGAGSAGAVMAARLSENPARKVLLLEAGHDYPSVEVMPGELLDPGAPVLDGHNWHISAQSRSAGLAKSLVAAGTTFLRAGMQDQRRMATAAMTANSSAGANSISNFDYAVGKVVGGSSATNGALALRGLVEDYNEWAQLTGDEFWSWDAVLPSLIALENDADRSEAFHGKQGPVPVSRESVGVLTPLQKAFFDACIAQGYPPTEDHNAPDSTGVGIVPKFVRDNRRMSSALTHLVDARNRPNLHIIPEALVDRLLWSNEHTCSGVAAIIDGKLQQFSAQRVIVCAGALNSPAILMRSGVGNPADLGKLKISPQIALAGVGENLRDHAVIGMWAVPQENVCQPGSSTHQVLLQFTCAQSSYRNDMHLFMLSGLDTGLVPMLKQMLGSTLGAAVTACLAKPVSTGHLRLTSSDPLQLPEVLVNCLKEEQDMRRMKEGARKAWDMIQSPSVKPLLRQIFAWNAGMFASDSILEKVLATFVRPLWHVVGTAKMGQSSDPMAVVDSRGKLHGVDNVWVADASIMPTIPVSPTHLSTVMLSERIAMNLQ